VIGTSGSLYSTPAAQTFNRDSAHERRAGRRSLRAYGYFTGGSDGAFGPGAHNTVLADARDTGAPIRSSHRQAALAFSTA
jgi:hypothetical protein